MVASCGMLTVLEIAPERKGCTADIISMWCGVVQVALAEAGAEGGVEDCEVFFFEAGLDFFAANLDVFDGAVFFNVLADLFDGGWS